MKKRKIKWKMIINKMECKEIFKRKQGNKRKKEQTIYETNKKQTAK